jgi:hypothetical protein
MLAGTAEIAIFLRDRPANDLDAVIEEWDRSQSFSQLIWRVWNSDACDYIVTNRRGMRS